MSHKFGGDIREVVNIPSKYAENKFHLNLRTIEIAKPERLWIIVVQGQLVCDKLYDTYVEGLNLHYLR